MKQMKTSKSLINAYKEFLEEYKAVGGKIVQF